jgi:hypothetical protein
MQVQCGDYWKTSNQKHAISDRSLSEGARVVKCLVCLLGAFIYERRTYRKLKSDGNRATTTDDDDNNNNNNNNNEFNEIECSL